MFSERGGGDGGGGGVSTAVGMESGVQGEGVVGGGGG